MLFRFGFAVDAAVFACFSVCQFEDMRNFLFYGCDAARIFAVNDVCQLFGQLRMEFSTRTPSFTTLIVTLGSI